ncbi:MAG: 1,4-dihydroxy-2-naphthoate polyprenyltransferase [Microbacteriaceae bacterium]
MKNHANEAKKRQQAAKSRTVQAAKSAQSARTSHDYSHLSVSFGDWVSGARIRTLGLAIAPVAIGVGASYVAVQRLGGEVSILLALLALAVALFLQIGVNFANDYSDGIRGTDEFRLGPARLTGSGRVAPKKVLLVALVFFALAALAGLAIVLLSGYYWLLAVGALAIVAAWFYTGGKRPYGYYGLGEVFVFIFFGMVATLGTTYVQVGVINQEAIFGGGAIGCIAVAVLLVNNLRDIDTDRKAKKRTLTVLIGKTATKILFVLTLLVIPFGLNVVWNLAYPVSGLNWFVLLLALPATVITLMAQKPKELVVALQLTSLSGLAYGLILGFSFFYAAVYQL